MTVKRAGGLLDVILGKSKIQNVNAIYLRRLRRICVPPRRDMIHIWNTLLGCQGLMSDLHACRPLSPLLPLF